MADLSELAEMIAEDPELVPEIVAIDARLAMKISRTVLATLLERANAVIPSKEVVPGTAYARLDASLGDAGTINSVTVTASDGVQTLTVVTDDVAVSVQGTALVPAKRLIDVLKLAPTNMVSIVIVGSAALVRSGRAQWTIQLPTLPPTDIEIPVTERVEVPRAAFAASLAVVGRALPSFNARPALHQVHAENGRLTAADGSRVHRVAVDMPKDLMFTIPARGLDQVLRMLHGSKSEHFEVGVHAEGVVFAVDADVLSMRRLAVAFPKVDDLLFKPAIENDAKCTVEPKALLDVIKRVRLASDAEFAAIVLTVVPEKKVNGEPRWSLQVSAKDRLGNASSERIECQWSGPVAGQSVTVNHRFLTDLLAKTDPELTTLRLGADTKTVKKPLYCEDSTTGFVGVVQQMRSDWAL